MSDEEGTENLRRRFTENMEKMEAPKRVVLDTTIIVRHLRGSKEETGLVQTLLIEVLAFVNESISRCLLAMIGFLHFVLHGVCRN